MPLLPKLKIYVDEIEALKERLFSSGFKPNQANEREAIAYFTAKYMTDYCADIQAIDDVIFNENYPVPIRIYTPNQTAPHKVALFMHGGGHMTGGISVYDKIARKLSHKTGCIVVSIEYRLSPEFAYPVGLNDCKCVTANIFDILDKRDICYINKELILVGDSSGGAICASIIMDEEFTGLHNIKSQVLICPSVDYTLSSNSVKELGFGYLLDKRELEFYFTNYFQNNEDLKSASPLFNKFYHNMPKTLIIVAEFDPLRGEAIEYYHKMQAVKADSKLIEIDGVVHPFLMLENLCEKECEIAYDAIAKFLCQAS